MAEEKPSPSLIQRLIHSAANGSALCFIIAIVSLGTAMVFGFPAVAIVALILPPVGIVLGIVPWVGALKAQRRDIAAGFAGMALNALLFAGIFYTFFQPPPCKYPHKKYACIANLKQLDGAKWTWALENHKTTNDIPTDSDLFGSTAYIRVKPTCPVGGIYRIGTVGEKLLCSVPGHTL